jgi:hypothetical protein
MVSALRTEWDLALVAYDSSTFATIARALAIFRTAHHPNKIAAKRDIQQPIFELNHVPPQIIEARRISTIGIQVRLKSKQALRVLCTV